MTPTLLRLTKEVETPELGLTLPVTPSIAPKLAKLVKAKVPSEGLVQRKMKRIKVLLIITYLVI
jgi:hypothetical protein